MATGSSRPLVIFLSGDVMVGRGIDQILAHPSDPALHECCVNNARDYLTLAERRNGPIPRPVDDGYIWGDALAEWERRGPAARIINLETSITTSSEAWPKGINYRMHPSNIGCLTRARVDCCVLANNHVLDWGYGGLAETLQVLRRAAIATAGAGEDTHEAAMPAVLPMGGQRLLVFSAGDRSSGIPIRWGAGGDYPGINFLPDLSAATVERIARQVHDLKSTTDLVIFSIHWGANWGYDISREQRWFAHRLIDEAGVDVIHGHSSHHAKGIEVYHGRPILYGAGDLINDYEGIPGYEAYRSDLALLYFVEFDPADHTLRQWQLVPMRVRRFQLRRASRDETEWLCQMFNREGLLLGTRVDIGEEGALHVRW